MPNHALLVDLSHLIYRSICVPQLAKMHTKVDKIPTGGIYGVLQSIYKCLEMDPTINQVYLLRDGYAKWRKDIYPEYKANRDANPESPNYKSYIEPDIYGWSKKDTLKYTNEIMGKLAANLGMRVIFDDLSEADDLAYLIGRELTESGTKITFLTSDKDWLQVINIFPNVQVFDGIKGEFYNKDNFKELFGYDVKWFLFQKAMLGDKSDNIPPVVKGCGEKAILKIIELLESENINPEDPMFTDKLVYMINNLDYNTLGRFKSIKNIDQEAIKTFNLNTNLMDFRRCPHSSNLSTTLLKESSENVNIKLMEAAKIFKELEFSNLGKILLPSSPFYRLN